MKFLSSRLSVMFILAGIFGIASLAPFAVVRSTFIAILLSVIIFSAGNFKEVTRSFPILAFFACFFVIPVWTLSNNPVGNYLHLIFLIASYCLYLIIYASSTDWTSEPLDKSDCFLFILLIITMIILYWSSLNSSIAWKGDSDAHMNIINRLCMYIVQNTVPIFGVACSYFFGFIYLKRRRRYLVGLSVICLLSVYFNSPIDREYDLWSWRYPLLFHYIGAIGAIPSLLAHGEYIPWLRISEVDYRIYNVLFFAGTAFFAVRGCLPDSRYRLLTGIVIITIPICSYYVGLTYIEPLSIFLMTIVLTNFPNWCDEYVSGKKSTWPLVCFLLLSFLKETNIIFTCSILFGVFCNYLFSTKKSLGNLTQVGKLILLSLMPYFIYFSYRGSTRTYDLNLFNVFEVCNWKIIAISILEQYGAIFLVVILFIFIKLYQRAVDLRFGISVFTIIAYILFFMSDGPVINTEGFLKGSRYLGYSRFNLYLMPGIFTIFSYACASVPNRKDWLPCIIFIVIALNIFMSPVQIVSGKRQAGWGDYSYSTSEYNYLYNELFAEIKSNKNINKVLIVGRSYPYPDEFYLKKFGLDKRKLKVAETEDINSSYDFTDFDLIVLHVPHRNNFAVPQILYEHYKLLKSLDGWGTSLMVFQKNINV